MSNGTIRKAQKYFRIISDNIKINIGKHPDAVITANI